MSGFALLSNFACHTCSSPSIMLPEELTEAAPIRCSGCGMRLGSWGAFKEQVRQVVMAEVETGAISVRDIGPDLMLDMPTERRAIERARAA